MSDPARHIEIEEIATAVVRAIVEDESKLRKVALQELKWLTMDDLMAITGYSRRTLDKWREKGHMRMFRPADSTEYRTTVQMWREDEEKLIKGSFLSKGGQKPTIDEPKKRLSKSRRDRVL